MWVGTDVAKTYCIQGLFRQQRDRPKEGFKKLYVPLRATNGDFVK